MTTSAQSRSAPRSLSTGAADRVLRPIRRSVEITIVTLFAVLTTAVFAQVVARYVFNQPPAWTEELARFCQVWIILLASSICIRKGSHLAVDYLGPALAPGARYAVALITGCLIAIYSAVVVIWGVRLLMIGLVQSSPAMHLNMGLVYLVFPIAGGLMFLESILATLQRANEPGDE
jgi:TRAP-type C4-dicarboxylate transport system permease small subunit